MIACVFIACVFEGEGRLVALSAQAGVENIAQAIAEEVDGEHGKGNRSARGDGQHGRLLHELLSAGVEHVAPGGGGHAHAQAEEAECGFDDNDRTNRDGGEHDNGREGVRQDVAEGEP